jgi:hypothetical protein
MAQSTPYLSVPEDLKDPLNERQRQPSYDDDAERLRDFVRKSERNEERVAHREEAPRDHLYQEL